SHACAVYLHGKLAHASDVAFGNHNFIQRLVARVLSPVAPQHGVQHGSLIEAVAACAPVLQSGIKVGEAHFRKKAEEPEIDAEKGRADSGEDTCGMKQSAIAAQHNHQ